MSYIPELRGLELEMARLRISCEAAEQSLDVPHCYDRDILNREAYNNRLFETQFDRCRPQKGSSLLRPPQTERASHDIQKQLKRIRPIPQTPYSTLDAPDMGFDFYSQPVHLSPQDDLAVALDTKVITKSANGKLTVLPVKSGQNPATCVQWVAGGDTLFTGFRDGHLFFSDKKERTTLTELRSGKGQITSAASLKQSPLLFIGTEQTGIYQVDVRAPTLLQAFGMHDGELCGLAISPDGEKIASGGDDNALKIWDLRSSRTPLADFRCHGAAVKALAWAPWQRELLFSGGGNADRTLKAISVARQKILAEKPTGGQVTAIHVCPHTQELVSCQAQDASCSIVWKYEDQGFHPMATLKASKTSVHHSTMSADGTSVVTGERDEKLYFWKVFEKASVAEKSLHASLHASWYSTFR